MQKIIADAGPLAGKSFNNALIDSYEVGGQNWSPAFREEFRKRRGYDLLRFLPSFSGRVVDSPEITERFLWDMRRTIADLFAENYYGHFRELCRQNGLLASIEPYTGPFESLQCGAAADLVMGEFWSNSQGHPSVKLASSVAHIYGKTIVGAESFTGNPNNAGKWLEDPYALKALGDLMYCWGLNRFIFHRYAMQPWTNRWPGMTMGQWGFHFDRTSTWWEPGRAWIEYCTRCQFMLQQGRSVADVAYFCGESAPVEMRSGHPPLPNGYDYDAINADVLLHHASVQDGRLTLDAGASYRVLVLPPDDPAITPRLLKRIRDLVRAGLIVLGAPPAHSPSLEDFPRCDAQVKALAAEMWGEITARDRVAADVSRRTISEEKLAPTDVGGYTATEHACGRGKVAWNKSLEEVLADAGEKPDFAFSSGSPDAKLVYVHRADKGADVYFVSNQRQSFDNAECTFRVSGRTPELWHPDTGLIEPAPVWSESAAGNAAADDKSDGRTRVRLQLDPAGSVFVVFRERSRGDHLVEAKSGLRQNNDWQVTLAKNGAPEITSCTNGSFELTTATGNKLKADLQDVPLPSEIAGPWTLRFPANWGAPGEVTLTNLTSWTEYPENGVRYFSGTATYSNELSISPEMLSNIRNVWLDLGRVKNLAEVVLNGRSLGILWKPPFRVDLTSAVHPGINRLEVKVTNLWPNRLIGDEQLPPDCEWNGKQLKEWPAWLLTGKPSPTGRLTFTTWHHWTKDSPLLESGLLGPVTLRVAEKATAVTMQ
jgi:hypothetical protein